MAREVRSFSFLMEGFALAEERPRRDRVSQDPQVSLFQASLCVRGRWISGTHLQAVSLVIEADVSRFCRCF